MKLKSLMLKDGIRLQPAEGAPIEERAMYTRPIVHFREEIGAEMHYDPITQLVTIRVRGLTRLVHVSQIPWMEPAEESTLASVLGAAQRKRGGKKPEAPVES